MTPPIYEYRAVSPKQCCPHCRDGYETLETVTAPPSTVCPKCGSPVQRILSAPSIGLSRSGLDDRAKNAGFSKLRRLGSGEYEKEY